MSPHGLKAPSEHFHQQGAKCPGCLAASRAALGIKPDSDPMESRPIRLWALLMAVIALAAVVRRLAEMGLL